MPAAERGEQAGPQLSISTYRNVTAVANLAAVADTSTSTSTSSSNTAALSSGLIPPSTGNPFGRSQMLRRSPTKSASVTDLRSTTTNDTTEQPFLTGRTQEQKLKFLSGNIEALQNYAMGRNNVHHEIKRLIRIIKLSYNDLEKTLETPKDVGKITVSTQTDAIVHAAPKSTKSSVTTEAPSKRQRELSTETPVSSISSKRQKSIKAQRRAVENAKLTHSATPLQRSDAQQDQNDWKTVAAKVKKKSRANHPKPEAIVIKTNGETSYADILRKVKTDHNLKDLGEKVFRIRRTQKGEMLLELNHETLSASYKANLELALGSDASVRAISQETTLIIKHLDEIATEEDICTGVSTLLEGAIPTIKWIAKGYSGTQTAGISLPNAAAKKLLEQKKIKIGWSVCTVKEYVQPKRCFKCMGFSHNAKDCKGVDRSKRCRKCGDEGHFANTCNKDLNCMLCSDAHLQPRNHACGSSRCPEYKKAIKSRLN